MMDEAPNSNHGGQLGQNSSSINFPNGKGIQEDVYAQRLQYSMPGILHFLQTEWARFEMERSQWEVERAELQARIAFLQGERKGQENLKQDLVRRIKMLEFALKQERAKYHKLKFGTDLQDLKPPEFDRKSDDSLNEESMNTPNSNVTWRQGRQLLRQYLQEIGYTDTIIDVRSARVRSLLGLQPNSENEGDTSPMVNGEGKGRQTDGQVRRIQGKKIPTSLAEGALIDSEASVLATFDFLAAENVVDDEDEDDSVDYYIDADSDEDDSGPVDEEAEERMERRRAKPKLMVGNESMAGVEDVLSDPDTEEALAEFDFLVSESGEGAGEARSQGDGTEWEKKDLSPSEEWGVDQQLISKLKEQYKKERKGKKGIPRPKRSTLQAMLANLGNDEDIPALQSGAASPPRGEIDDGGVQSGGVIAFPRKQMVPGDEDALDAALGLGDLAGLTVNNEADPLSYDISATKEAFRKTWNAKYTLRSHFDGVRALTFHPVEPVLITASEDHTLKLWNLQKTVPAKKATSLDVEPVYTFRAHVGPVLCLAMSATGEQCFSGGIDSTIRCWNIPSSNIDPYDSFDPSVLADTYVAHTDAVWGLSVHSSRMQLLSCSADGTVKLWNPGTKSPLLNSYTVENEGVPTSVDFVRCDPNQMVASYTSANTFIYDLETGKQVVMLDTKTNSDNTLNQINAIVSHPTLPVTITAHEDRHIRFFDNNTGKVLHSMVAHLDAVTSLAVDPNGLYLLSGSHDCSIRLWNLDSKTCVQEITSHRKKFEESIYDVAFHPSKPYIASAGADALAKVFV